MSKSETKSRNGDYPKLLASPLPRRAKAAIRTISRLQKRSRDLSRERKLLANVADELYVKATTGAGDNERALAVWTFVRCAMAAATEGDDVPPLLSSARAACAKYLAEHDPLRAVLVSKTDYVRSLFELASALVEARGGADDGPLEEYLRRRPNIGTAVAAFDDPKHLLRGMKVMLENVGCDVLAARVLVTFHLLYPPPPSIASDVPPRGYLSHVASLVKKAAALDPDGMVAELLDAMGLSSSDRNALTSGIRKERSRNIKARRVTTKPGH